MTQMCLCVAAQSHTIEHCLYTTQYRTGKEKFEEVGVMYIAWAIAQAMR